MKYFLTIIALAFFTLPAHAAVKRMALVNKTTLDVDNVIVYDDSKPAKDQYTPDAAHVLVEDSLMVMSPKDGLNAGLNAVVKKGYVPLQIPDTDRSIVEKLF